MKHLISQFAFPLLLIMLSSFSYVYVSFRFPILLRLLFLPITVLLGCLPHESSWQWQYPSHCELLSPTTFKHSEVGGWTQPSTEVNGTGRSCFAVSIINWGSSKSENKGSQAEELTHAYWLRRLSAACVLTQQIDYKIAAFSWCVLHHAKQCHSQCRTDRHSCPASVLYPQSISIGSRSAFWTQDQF